MLCWSITFGLSLTHLNVTQVAVNPSNRSQQQRQQFYFVSLHLAALWEWPESCHRRLCPPSCDVLVYGQHVVKCYLPVFGGLSLADSAGWTRGRGTTPRSSCIRDTYLKKLSGQPKSKSAACHPRWRTEMSGSDLKRGKISRRFGRWAAPGCRRPETSSVRRITSPAGCSWRAHVAAGAAPRTSHTSDWVTRQRKPLWLFMISVTQSGNFLSGFNTVLTEATLTAALRSSGELAAFCTCRTAGSGSTRIPTRSAGAAWPPDVEHLHNKKWKSVLRFPGVGIFHFHYSWFRWFTLEAELPVCTEAVCETRRHP